MNREKCSARFYGVRIAFIILTIFLAAIVFIKPQTAFAEGELIKNISISVKNDFTEESNLLLKSGDFSYTKQSYDLGSKEDSAFAYHVQSTAQSGGFQLRFSFEAAEGVTVTATHYTNGTSSMKDITSVKWADSLQCGKNSFEIKASDGTNEKTYVFSINVMPTLEGLSLKTANYAVHFTPDFSSEVTEYSAKISSAITSVSVTASPENADYKIAYNGGTSANVPIGTDTDKITVKVTGGAGENALSTEYAVSLIKSAPETVAFGTVPADATVAVYDSFGERIYPDSFGGKTFTGVFTGEGCTYTVSKSGYISKNGTVTAGTLNVSLSEAGTAPDSLSAEWKNFRNSDCNMAITSAKTSVSENTELLWSKSLGTGFENAVGLPLIVDGDVFVTCGTKIKRLDFDTGAEKASADIAGEADWGYTPMTYAGGMIFLPLGDGTVQALNASTLESLWVYKDSLGGQSLSPITYSDGYIYTGFWNGENKDANFVCLSVSDENTATGTENKAPVWKITQQGGFYWAGSVVVGDAVIFGCDDGETGFDGDGAVIRSLNKYTGETVSEFNITGDQRSSIAYSSERGEVYFTTKCGYLYSANINSGTGVLTDLKYKDYGAQSTSTPVYYSGRLYFGIGGGITTSGSSGKFACANADSLEEIYSVDLKGYPQCSFLLSTAYLSTEGKLCFYSSYNASPGGIALIETTVTSTSATVKYIYEPENAQYCICSPICDSDGNIFYKNDSGTLFAVKGAKSSTVSGLTEEKIVTQIREAKAGETVTLTITDMETTVSRQTFRTLMSAAENVTLCISGPSFRWYFNAESFTEAPEENFSPWVTVSSHKTIANGYFPDKKVLSVTFAEKDELPARAMLMLPRLSAYYESETLANSAGAALYEYTRESVTDANMRFAYDEDWFAITVTELKDYLITEAEPAVVTQETPAGESADKPQIPETPSEDVSEKTDIPNTENINAEQYSAMAEALTESVGNLRTLDSALTELDAKYNSDMTLMTVAACVGMLIVSACAGTVVYLAMKRKIKSGAMK